MRLFIGGAVLVGALASAACHTMKPVALNELVALNPDRVWVTDSDKSVVIVAGPINVTGDTLLGYVAGKYEEMPSAGFKQIVVERPSSSKTVLLVSAIAVGVGGFIYAITGSGSSSTTNPISGDCDKHPELCMQ